MGALNDIHSIYTKTYNQIKYKTWEINVVFWLVSKLQAGSHQVGVSSHDRKGNYENKLLVTVVRIQKDPPTLKGID